VVEMNADKKHKRLSVEELKRFKGFENVSDQEADETILVLEKLSILFYELHMKQRMKKQKLTLIKGGELYEDEQRNAA
jgi:hypothetical protein